VPEGASVRLSWHRSLTRNEIRLLMALLGANVLVLFFTIGADHEWHKEQIKAAKEKRPAEPDPVTFAFWNHFQATTWNILCGRLHCLLLASFRHGDELHTLGNMALLMAVAPGILAALGPRRSIFLYVSAAAVGFAAELACWDYLRPMLAGQPVHPSATEVHRRAKIMEEAEKKGVALEALPQESRYDAHQWRCVYGSSGAVLGVAATWLCIYSGTPLGRSPLGRVVAGVVALVLARDLYVAARTMRSADPVRESKNTSLVVHGTGAAFGALYFLVALRKAKLRLQELRRAAEGPIAAAVNRAAVMPTSAPTAASSALKPASSSGSVSGLASKLSAPSPANKGMRATPPVVKPRRGFATWARSLLPPPSVLMSPTPSRAVSVRRRS